MNKKIKLALGAIPFASLSAFAEGEGSGTISLTAVEGAAGQIQTALTSFFNTTLIPLVVAVGGVALGVYLVLALFRWARKIGK